VEPARELGAFYTPSVLAEPLGRWAIRAGTDRVLDPSCGEGAFLVRAVDRLLGLEAQPRRLSDQIAGVELNARALTRARGALLSRHPGLRWGRLVEDDFFGFVEENLGKLSFDAVLGNPPFLRTQGRSTAFKHRALRAARACGAELTADASLWAPFVAAATGFVKPGGRLAMIVPREALFVNYTKPLLAMLKRRFARVELVALDEYWFEGALVKVAMLLCDGVGPGTLRLLEAKTADRLEALLEEAPDLEAASSWVWPRVPAECRPAARRALESPDLSPLTHLAQLSIGIVTGEKDYFLLPESTVRGLGLPREFLSPALSKPSQLPGTTFSHPDLASLAARGEPCQLLTVPTDYAGGSMALDAYLARGSARGIDQNYKCRTRKPWFSVRRVLTPPDAFLGYLVKRRPRLSSNSAEVRCTNNLHRLYFEPPWDQYADVIAAASLNAATMLSIELLGRIAAGGVLKIEPGDASKIRLIHPGRLLKLRGARARASAIDRALRLGRDGEAYALADQMLGIALGWEDEDVERLRRAHMELRNSRLSPRSPRAPGGPAGSPDVPPGATRRA
jgi:tRNA1(Val) A37 N6-methylase TrmN6